MENTTQADHEVMAEFRYQIRRYIRTAEGIAREVGLEPQQHQLLLAVRGFPGGASPTIGDVAERLQVRHHSAVELLNRMEQRGLLVRRPTGVGRTTTVHLTPLGRRTLERVTRRLRPELSNSARRLIDALSGLADQDSDAAPLRTRSGRYRDDAAG